MPDRKLIAIPEPRAAAERCTTCGKGGVALDPLGVCYSCPATHDIDSWKPRASTEADVCRDSHERELSRLTGRSRE